MHGWRLRPWEIFLLFKTMRNTKIVEPVLTMNTFYYKDDILQKKVKIPLKKCTMASNGAP